MQLLLCSATETEIKPTIEYLKQTNNQNVEVLITGVGLMATAYALLKKILTKKPDFILQAGVAGCIDRATPLTQIVVVEKESIGDLGVEENGKFNSIFDLNLQQENIFPWKNGKLSNNIEQLKQSGLTIVDGISVNEISTDKKRIEFYKTNLNAQIETMEGAALHYVALMENIPFLQMRSISNYAGERDKKEWDLEGAITNLNIQLRRTLPKILNQ